jgi:hypothetical protein
MIKYWRFIAIGLAAALLIYYYFAVYKDAKQMDVEQAQQQNQAPNQKQWETKTEEQATPLIKVLPLKMGKDLNPWEFEITFTTHSGDINLDMMKDVTLVDDKGNIFQPIRWDGPEPEGHHVSGKLIFNQINPFPKSVEMKFKNVGEIAERSLKWNLE